MSSAVKSVFKGVKRAFKAVTKSGWGKALLIAAAVFTGGAALGMWASPWASLNGALVSAAGEAAATGSAGAVAAGAGGAEVLGGAAGEALAGTGEALAAGEAAAAGGIGDAATSLTTQALAESGAAGGLLNSDMGNTMLANNGVTGTMTDAVDLVGQPLTPEAANVSEAARMLQTSGNGPLSTDPSSVALGTDTGGTFAQSFHQPGGMWNAAAQEANKSLSERLAAYFQDWFKGDLAKFGATQAGVGLVKGAFTPNAKDIAEAQADARIRMEADQRTALQPNFAVGTVALPTPAVTPIPLRRPDGSAVFAPGGGIINNGIRRPT